MKITAGKKTLTTDKAGKATGAKAPTEVVVAKTGYATMTVETAPPVATTTTRATAATTTTRPSTRD